MNMRGYMGALAAALTGTLMLMTACHHSMAGTKQGEGPDYRGMWVDSVYQTLSERQRVAQLFIPHAVVSNNADGRAKVKQWVEVDGVGGLLFNKGTLESQVQLDNYAQSRAKVPLMIAADAEWGMAMRLSDAPRFPYNLAIGAGNDTAAVAAYGREMARELRRVGITVDFAPDIDINSNPDNPIIGYRSFGENPKHVAELASAFARGLGEGGVLAVAKHFPGHGDTNSDSHKTLPTVSRTKQQIEQTELVPFRQLIEDGVGGVMVGHLNIPALDNSGTPASLSFKVTTDLLKKDLGFKGLVFTDALEMNGAKVKGKNNCVLALLAGADVLLGSSNPTTDIDAVMQALKDGILTWARVNESVRKVLSAKYDLGLTTRQVIDSENVTADVASLQADAVNRRLSAMAITVVKNHDHLLPADDVNKPLVVTTIGGSNDNVFVKTVKSLRSNVTIVSPDGSIPDKAIVLACVIGSSATDAEKLAALKRKVGDRLVPVMMMTAYKTRRFASTLKALPTWVLAGDNTLAMCEMAAQSVMGAIPVTGRVPVNIPGVASMGEGVSLTREVLGRSSLQAVGADPKLGNAINALIDKGLDTGAFTGCQVIVVQNGQIVYDRSAGYTDSSKKVKVTDQTLFDLASVSKTVGTMSGLMAAYDRGLWRLDDLLSKFMPELKGNSKGDLKMKELLYHETGLPAALNMNNIVFDPESYSGPIMSKTKSDVMSVPMPEGYWGNKNARLRSDLYSIKETDDYYLPVAEGLYAAEWTADTILQRVINAKQAPAKKYKYSDLNFVLLMAAEESMTGHDHDDWFTSQVAEPLGTDRLTYLPLDYFPKSSIAATENDKFVRKQQLQGYVHDELAAMSGGVQGNAGLFGTATDLAKWCQMLIDGGTYGDKHIFSQSTVDTFLKSRSPSGKRGLGFDTARNGMFVGHTGFTGTAYWIDPARKLAVIVLTNRVSPTRDNHAWSALNLRSEILRLVDEGM